MSTATGLAWANFLSSLGGAAPGILRNYNEDANRQNLAAEKAQLDGSVANIIKGMPQVGSSVLDDMTTMQPAQAKQVWDATPPETKQEALSYMSGKQGLDALRMKMPQAIPDRPDMGSAVATLAKPAPDPTVSTVEALRPVIKDMESGGRYNIFHPKTASGKQALGAYGILPDTWFPAFPQFGLDAHNKEDVNRFLSSPSLQDAMFSEIAKKGLSETGGDLRKFRAWYYGGPDSAAKLGTGNEWTPQSAFSNGQKVKMPSVGEDADAFMKRLTDAGVDPSQMTAPTAPAGLPWDNSLLESLVKDRPTMPTMPKKVTYGDQEKYLLSKVTNPEQYALMKDMISGVSGLAKQERDSTAEAGKSFDERTKTWNSDVEKNAQLQFDTWKANLEHGDKTSTRKDESLTALRQQRESKQKELADLREFQKRVEKDGATESIAAAYPDFITTEEPGVLNQLIHGSDAVGSPILNKSKVSEKARALQEEIDAIDERLSTKSGAAVQSPQATGPAALSKYLKPRN